MMKKFLTFVLALLTKSDALFHIVVALLLIALPTFEIPSLNEFHPFFIESTALFFNSMIPASLVTRSPFTRALFEIIDDNVTRSIESPNSSPVAE